MKISEAIDMIDSLKPNAFTQEEKVGWLNTIDGLIKRTVIDTHEGDEEVTFTGYDQDTPLDTELLVGEPYTDLYIHYLESKIDYHNREYDKYNNSITRYNDIFEQFSNWYNRTYMPKKTSLRYW